VSFVRFFRAASGSGRGDIIITLDITIPKDVSDELEKYANKFKKKTRISCFLLILIVFL
jgi:DnaJ-class molecular chaperone